MLILLTVLHIRQLNRRYYFCLVAITTQVVANSLKVWFSKLEMNRLFLKKKKLPKKLLHKQTRLLGKKKQSTTEIQQRRSSSSDLFAAALAAAALSLLCFCSAA